MSIVTRVLFALAVVFGALGLQALNAQAAENCTYPSHVDYVLPRNCEKACIEHGHHPVEYCRKTVGSCERCWRDFEECTRTRASCRECSDHYARCMEPLHY